MRDSIKKNHFWKDIAKFNVSVCKYVLGLPKHECDTVVLSELGLKPFSVLVEAQIF